ncbi:MAG TPA: hypothetical protein VFL36_05080 [Myxococcales bacterium]|nr:hypothetical protein [Myxococcales bacterium]
MNRAVLLAAALGCASSGHWPPRPAERPATPMELEFYDTAVHAPTPAERAALAQALTAHHFRVVPGKSRKGHWDVALTHEGDRLVATLRSDGFFVDEAVGADVDALADTLARSQRVLEFVQNSGLPQQHMIDDGH